MHELKERSLGPGERRWKVPAAAIAAGLFLVASVAPSAAFGPTTWRPIATHDYAAAEARHHVYRGAPEPTMPAASRGTADVDVTLAADEIGPETAYCAHRFKSYDPSTGTYLGFDGRERACP